MSASESEPSAVLLDVRTRLDELTDDYRSALHGALDGLTEAEADILREQVLARRERQDG